jgi:hypothetical protein
VMKYSKRLIAVGDEHEIKIPDELQWKGIHQFTLLASLLNYFSLYTSRSMDDLLEHSI